jgi:Lhr-like helicase
MITAKRSIRMAVLPATLALFIAASLPSWAGDPHLRAAMTIQQATRLASTAKTAKDHQKLAKYFNQQADASEAAAKDHEAMIEAFRKTPGGDRMIEHCESLVKSNRELAQAFREMAAGHEGMAKEAR